jgi:hypothetical protein
MTATSPKKAYVPPPTTSLKAYMPPLARLLGTTPATLYERQRSLVRAGLLDAGSGWGPGSGVRTTAGSVALLLISVLASDSLTISESRTGDIANAAPLGIDRCPLTGTRSFWDALAVLLGTRGKSRRVNEIRVSRTATSASIFYRDGSTIRTSEFAGPSAREPGLRVVATLARDPFRTVADDVRAMVGEKFNELDEEEGRTAQ